MYEGHVGSVWDVERVSTTQAGQLSHRSESDRALFSAILGGSPGNFGIITHYDVEVHRNTSYMFKKDSKDVLPQYYRGFHIYREESLRKCLSKVAEMADNPNFPSNYDLCISVLSATNKLGRLGMPGDSDDPESADIFGSAGPATFVGDDYQLPSSDLKITNIDESDSEMVEEVEMIKKEVRETAEWPRVVVIYAQWVPFSVDDSTYYPNWFKFFEDLPMKLPKLSARDIALMSGITQFWLFGHPREFPQPYENRTYLTTSKNLTDSNWPAIAAKQIEKVVGGPMYEGTPLQMNCYLAVQIQPYGGINSKFFTNATNPDIKTSYSWRDSTVVQVLDCFSTDKKPTRRLAKGE